MTDVWQLKQEAQALEELSRHLFLEAHDMQNMRERVEWALTWRGKYFNCLGYFFSLYCMWKIVIVSNALFVFVIQKFGDFSRFMYFSCAAVNVMAVLGVILLFVTQY